MEIKPALYALDQDQTYDLLWANNLSKKHFNFLARKLAKNWLLPFENLREFPKYLIERYTPFQDDWAYLWSEKTYQFLKTLSRYGIYDNPYLTGEAQGVENYLKLELPEFEEDSSEFLGLGGTKSLGLGEFPGSVEIQVSKGDSIIINWLGFAHSEYLAYTHPSVDDYKGRTGVINQFRREFTAHKDEVIFISTRGMLINSLVISGNYQTKENSKLIFYKDLDKTYNHLLKILELPKPKILTSFNYSQEHQRSWFYWEDGEYERGSVRKFEFTNFKVSNPTFTEVPEWYYFTSLIYANNNYWGESSPSNDLGKPISLKIDKYLLFKMWDIGFLDEEKTTLFDLQIGGTQEPLKYPIKIYDQKYSEYPIGDRFNGFEIARLRRSTGIFDSLYGVGKYYDGFADSAFTQDLRKGRSAGTFLFSEAYSGIGSKVAGKDFRQNLVTHAGLSNVGYFSKNIDPRLIKSYSRFLWWPSLHSSGTFYHHAVFANPAKIEAKLYEAEIFIAIKETIKQEKEGFKIIRETQIEEKEEKLIHYTEHNITDTGDLRSTFIFDTLNPKINQKYKSSVTKDYKFELTLQEELASRTYLSTSQVVGFIEEIYRINYNPEGYIMPDSIRIKEIHAALGASKFVSQKNNSGAPITANLGYYIERIGRVLGISVNPDGSVRSIRQSRHIKQGDKIPAGWSIGQWGRNQGGSGEGQRGGNSEDDKDGIAYEVIGDKFTVNPFTGEPSKIEGGGYVLCENWPQYLEILKDDLDRCLGLQQASANALPNGRGDGFLTYEGLHSLLTELAFMQSVMSEQTSKSMVAGLANQAINQELIASLGVPIQIKEIKALINGEEAIIPYPGLTEDAPTQFNLASLILANISPLMAALTNWNYGKPLLEEKPDGDYPELKVEEIHHLFDLATVNSIPDSPSDGEDKEEEKDKEEEGKEEDTDDQSN